MPHLGTYSFTSQNMKCFKLRQCPLGSGTIDTPKSTLFLVQGQGNYVRVKILYKCSKFIEGYDHAREGLGSIHHLQLPGEFLYKKVPSKFRLL